MILITINHSVGKQIFFFTEDSCNHFAESMVSLCDNKKSREFIRKKIELVYSVIALFQIQVVLKAFSCFVIFFFFLMGLDDLKMCPYKEHKRHVCLVFASRVTT